MTTSALKFINTYIDKRNPKRELNGALLDCERNMIVATDTRAILAFRHKLDFQGIIPKKSFEMSIKATTKNSPLDVSFRERVLRDDEKESYLGQDRLLEIMSDEIVIGSPEIYGEFPAWDRIVHLELEKNFDLDFEGEVTYFDEAKENPKPKMKILEVNSLYMLHVISKLGAIVDSKYISPAIDYIKENAISSKVKICFTTASSPIRIEHDDFILVIMTIVV